MQGKAVKHQSAVYRVPVAFISIHLKTKNYTCSFFHLGHQAPVVQTLDSAIHRINHYPADKYYGNQFRYPLDSDLSSG